MSSSIVSPFPVFNDLDGTPLEAGYIYIGTSNLNPEVSPINVFWDAALTVPAAQPIRTVGGYASRNGSPSRMYVSADTYSITVRNRNRVFVFAATGDQTPGSAVSFIQAGTGAVTRNMQDKVRESVSVKDFGAVGDGVADDTGALTAFFNSAIANPGVQHVLFKQTYAVSAVMPTINVSNVWISGAGADFHDAGSPVLKGTVIKWIGASNLITPIVTITSVSGASARVSSVKFTGIGIDCNGGLAAYGLKLASVWNCDIDVAIIEAKTIALNCTVVASLGENRCIQQSRIRFKSRQFIARTGFGMVCGGDDSANFSMNQVWMDAQHTDIQSLYLVNSDNNDWIFFRAYSAGTATESVSCLGGTQVGNTCRSERFWQFTANKPLHAYGSSGSPTFAYPSVKINIYNLDKENGTPNPTVETGASVFWKNDSAALPSTPWVSYTPIITSGSGTITTKSATGKYIQRGNIVYLKAEIAITTNGTGASFLTFTLPVQSGASATPSTMSGRERAITGSVVCGQIEGSTTTCNLQKYDGTYPGGDGYVIIVSGFYEVA
jgi:hypothetical protein